MPTISMFYGIIRMYCAPEEHNPPMAMNGELPYRIEPLK